MMIVKASHGYQPTGVTVQKGSRYNISATGRWTLDAGKTECDADGLSSGRGRLEGIVLDENFELGKPFPLGSKGTFRPKTTGRLYLRCRDAWHQLADNRQRLSVVIHKSR